MGYGLRITGELGNRPDKDRWMAASLVGIKKVADRPVSRAAVPAAGKNLISAKPAAANLSSNKVALAAAAESAKTEPAKAESLGAVDYTGRQIVHGVANTKSFRYKFDKQLRGVIGKSGLRDAVMKEFTHRASVSGRLTVKEAKRAVFAAQDAGHITRGQAGRLMDRMGI